MTMLLRSVGIVLLFLSANQAVLSEELCIGTDGVCNGEPNSNDLFEISARYGKEQVADGDFKVKTLEHIREVNTYMIEKVFKEEKFVRVKDECQNRHELCAFWAAVGECDVNPKYMTVTCAPSCFSCEKIDFDYRCPRNHDLEDVFKPGDLNKMFERIVYGEEFASLNTTVLSSPNEDKTKPWVIIIDDFLTKKEVDTLIHYGEKEGYERSSDVGKKKFDGTYDSKQSSSRTSENSWCKSVCYEDPVVMQAIQKIEKITGIPDKNAEHLQLLRYYEGQYYKTHHDFITFHVNRNVGPRILTAFLYLNDVEQGGGTNFPNLDLTVMPKMGRVLIWPSVLDSNLNESDSQTYHQALPVEKGVKFGANAWLHLRPFKDEWELGCV